MKRISLLSIILLSIVFTSVSLSQFHMAVGPAFGMNFNLHGGSDVESGTGFGIAFAGKADMSFDRSRSLGVIFGLAFYDGRGGSSSNTGTSNGTAYTQDNDVSISYFQIEALFRYRLQSGIYIFFGPQIGFCESAESEIVYTWQGGSQKEKSSIKDTPARFEIKTGAGYDIPLSKLITLSPELSFGMGLTNAIKDVKYHIHTIQAIVVCKFNII